MNKVDKINQAIEKHEQESKRLKLLLHHSAHRCFECEERKDLTKDPHHRDTFWCKTHYPMRHKIINDFIDHAVYGR